MSENEDLIALLTELLTCRNGAHHYCPNCDNGINPERIIKPVRDALAHAATRERQAYEAAYYDSFDASGTVWNGDIYSSEWLKKNADVRESIDRAYARYQQQARTPEK